MSAVNATQGIVVMSACFASGAAASLLAVRWPRLALWVGHAALTLGALAGAFVALTVLGGGGAPVHLDLPVLFPFARLTLSVDGLAAFFLLVVTLVAVAAGVYGPAYVTAHARGTPAEDGAAAAGVHVLALNVFVGSMALLACAGDALTFLILWEGMTLASYALVVSDTSSEAHTRAGLLYIVMAHIGTAFLLLVFLVLAERGGDFGFEALREAARGLSDPARSALFFFALTGFGAKAGVMPLHVWLPYAHPAAPSHVSALMSGVMLKVAIYGIFRFAFDILAPASGPLPASWGWTVLAAGVVSMVVGVLYALQQHDLKRLLAFHSVENVGIILVGAALAMLLTRRGDAAAPLAVVALVASLLHTVNHAAFKGLLFLGAGAVLCRTHTGNMEEQGGLARRMPYTAWMFLLGAVAISALPPLNGFVSEWLTFQALVQGGARLGGAASLFAVFAASMLALTGGLAAACFVKAFGVTFLGRPRSKHAEHAVEVPVSMRVASALLAVACVLLGVAPGYLLRLLDLPALELTGRSATSVLTARGPLVLSTSVGAAGTSISVTLVALLLCALAALAWLVRAWPRRPARRFEPTWTCGMTPTSRFDYTATAFAKPLRLIFALLYRPRRQVERSTAGSPYFVTRVHYAGEIVDIAEIHLYHRVRDLIAAVAHGIRAKSTGSIHGYIAFVLATLLVALLISVGG